MSKKPVQKPAAVSGEIRNKGDAKAKIGHGGEVNALDKNGDAALNLANVFGETRNAAGDVDDARSAVELHHESDAKYVQCDDETMIVESDESETSEHSYTTSGIEELIRNNANHDGLITETDADKEESDIQTLVTNADADDDQDFKDVCEKDEVENLSELHLAAERGDKEDVSSLLMWSANVDVLDTKHNTPLHYATLNGHFDVVYLLLNKNASVNLRNAFGQTSLHLAAEQGHLAIAQILLKRSLLMSSANVDVLDTRHNTPLHIATLNGHVDVVNILLSNNASVNSRNALGQTSLHLAAVIGHSAIAQLLLKSNADVHVTDQSNNTPINIAIRRGYSELVHLLMTSIEYPHKWVTSLHFAAKCGNTRDVQRLLLNSDENPDTTSLYGDTPLHLASENGHFEVIEVLLRNNADANIRNASCKTPLHFAAAKGYVEIAKTIIDHEGALNAVDINGDTALHHAACNGHIAVVNVLLNVNTEMDAQIHSQLAVTQVPPAELELSKHPIRNTVDVDQTSNQIAAESGNVEIVDIQLSHSSALSGECRGQATTSDLAAEHRHTEIVENLIFQEATVNACNKTKMTPLHLTSRFGHLYVDDILQANNATANVTKQFEETPFYLAARNGKNLMFNDATVNACNNAKMTPLHLACQNGHTSIVEILLENHAIVDVSKQSKETPLYLAAKNGHAGVTDILMRRGVYDFVGITWEYETLLGLAVEEGHAEVVEVILKHSCRLYEKLTKDRKKLRENIKRSVMPVELLKSDGRRVSVELFWREGITPLKILWDLGDYVDIAREEFSWDQKIDKLCLSVYQCIYSEADIAKRFHDMVTNIPSSDFSRGFPSDLIKYRINFRKDAQFLINSSTFIANHQDEELNTFLHVVHRQEKNEPEWLHLQNQLINDVIQLLLENGADFNMKNSDGETPLMFASQKGDCDVIQIFFDWEQKSGMKLDLDARDRKGESALIKAVEWNHVSVMQLLVNHKASVNLHDYYGFTALHTAIYEPNKNSLDFDILCKGLRKRKFDGVNSLEVSTKDKPTQEEETVNPYPVIGRLQNYLECSKETTQLREEMVQLLLDNDETNVNAIDFRGNSPLDLAVKSSKQINSATFEALKNRGATRNLPEPEDEAPIEVARIDGRGRNLLHRLIIALTFGDMVGEQNHSLMIDGILLRTENFRNSATATDDNGRTPLHYAVMSKCCAAYNHSDLVTLLLKLGSNVNAADMYGKTPLHYAEMDDEYKLLVQYGANENTKDKKGHTPTKLKKIRESVKINERNADYLPFGNKALQISRDSAQVVVTNDRRILATVSPSHRPVETIRIFSQSPRLQESTEETIWKLWTEKELIRLNRSLNQLKPSVQHFIKRLADGIKEKDRRFECEPILVGSADEETKVVIEADFDFNFKLIKFSKICDPFPHPIGSKGYFQLRRKRIVDIESWNDGRFACFFNSDQCLLTNEVNSTFQIILEEVLGDHNFWEDEHLLQLSVSHAGKRRSEDEKPDGLCRTLKLRMIDTIEDTEGGSLFVNISIDVVACVHVEGWWSEDPLPVGINPYVKAHGSTFVFDRPRFDLSKLRGTHFLFSDTFARISFALVESRIIKECSSLIKSAYMVCKMILYSNKGTTYQLKNCFFFCMEALNARSESKTRNEDEITPKQLAFWVERIMFSFVEFSRYDVYPCYFMPSFKLPVKKLSPNSTYAMYTDDTIRYHAVYDKYLEVCPDDTAIDITMNEYEITEECLYPNCDSKWEQFDREEFIRKLSSRSSS